jgi:hypothetical protein
VGAGSAEVGGDVGDVADVDDVESVGLCGAPVVVVVELSFFGERVVGERDSEELADVAGAVEVEVLGGGCGGVNETSAAAWWAAAVFSSMVVALPGAPASATPPAMS